MIASAVKTPVHE